MESGARFLDLGCCFGQIPRKLVLDGAPAAFVYGAELRGESIDLGYDLFLDRDKLAVQFLTADILDPNSLLKETEGQMSIVYTGLFLRLFDWEGQRKTCERILKPEKGVLVLGQQVGSLVPCDVVPGEGDTRVMRHDEAGFERLWNEVGERTGSDGVVRAKWNEGLGVEDGRRSWDNVNVGL